jgi:hypothetical protein
MRLSQTITSNNPSIDSKLANKAKEGTKAIVVTEDMYIARKKYNQMKQICLLQGLMAFI